MCVSLPGLRDAGAARDALPARPGPFGTPVASYRPALPVADARYVETTTRQRITQTRGFPEQIRRDHERPRVPGSVVGLSTNHAPPFFPSPSAVALLAAETRHAPTPAHVLPR